MRHVFQAKTLICACGWGWFSHQRDPRPCPSAAQQAGIDLTKPSAKANGSL
jgi:hypothetical protein